MTWRLARNAVVSIAAIDVATAHDGAGILGTHVTRVLEPRTFGRYLDLSGVLAGKFAIAK
jgi:hypothetical protein